MFSTLHRFEFFSLITIFFFSACVSSLPEKRPSDFEFRYDVDGGMLPQHDRLEIRDTVGLWSFWKERVDVQVHFSISAQEADLLYSEIRKSQFDRITSSEQKVYDRGGTSMELTAGGKTYEVRNNGMSFIDSRWAEPYGALRAFVDSFPARIKSEAIPLSIQWEPILSTAQLEISAGNAYVGRSEGSSGCQILFSRHGQFPIRLTYKDSTISDTVLQLSQTSAVRLELQNGIPATIFQSNPE